MPSLWPNHALNCCPRGRTTVVCCVSDGAPLSPDVSDDVIAAAMALAHRRVAILTGAGVSTDSGIPDYRGDETRRRARRPIRFNEFVGHEDTRRRYWARAFVGWPRIRDAQSNSAHQDVAAVVCAGRGTGVVTQNVDGLHQHGGAPDDVVVELHGALRVVRCLGCGAKSSRELLQARLAAQNPWLERFVAAGVSDAIGAAPDGDVDLEGEAVARFVVVGCDICGGELKPDVVFFGENVDPRVLARAWAVVDDADALLVLGSSLEVFSGRRFVEAMAKRGKPVVIVNRGPTRSDGIATVKLDMGVAPAMTALRSALS